MEIYVRNQEELDNLNPTLNDKIFIDFEISTKELFINKEYPCQIYASTIKHLIVNASNTLIVFDSRVTISKKCDKAKIFASENSVVYVIQNESQTSIVELFDNCRLYVCNGAVRMMLHDHSSMECLDGTCGGFLYDHSTAKVIGGAKITNLSIFDQSNLVYQSHIELTNRLKCGLNMHGSSRASLEMPKDLIFDRICLFDSSYLELKSDSIFGIRVKSNRSTIVGHGNPELRIQSSSTTITNNQFLYPNRSMKDLLKYHGLDDGCNWLYFPAIKLSNNEYQMIRPDHERIFDSGIRPFQGGKFFISIKHCLMNFDFDGLDFDSLVFLKFNPCPGFSVEVLDPEKGIVECNFLLFEKEIPINQLTSECKNLLNFLTFSDPIALNN